MDKDTLLIKLKVELLSNLLLKNKDVSAYEVFEHRKQLRLCCKHDKKASDYLEQLIVEAEISLQNILNFYPHK